MTKAKLNACTDRGKEELVLGDTHRGDRSNEFDILDLFDTRTLRRRIFSTGLIFSHC